MKCHLCDGEGVIPEMAAVCPVCEGSGTPPNDPVAFLAGIALFLLGAYGIHFVLMLLLAALHAGPWAVGVSMITACMLSAYCFLR